MIIMAKYCQMQVPRVSMPPVQPPPPSYAYTCMTLNTHHTTWQLSCRSFSAPDHMTIYQITWQCLIPSTYILSHITIPYLLQNPMLGPVHLDITEKVDPTTHGFWCLGKQVQCGWLLGDWMEGLHCEAAVLMLFLGDTSERGFRYAGFLQRVK